MKQFLVIAVSFILLSGCTSTINIQNDLFGQIESDFKVSDFLNSEIKKYNGNGIVNLKIKNEIPTQTYLMNGLVGLGANLLTANSSSGIKLLGIFAPYLISIETIEIEYQVVKNK